MRGLLRFARGVDRVNEGIGRSVKWLVLAATLIAAGNALLRYGFDLGSNAWLEAQWYLFALIVLLGAGYTLKHDGHVRVDLFYARGSPRTRAWIDLAGTLLFLLPLAGLLVWLSWGFFVESWRIGETSPDAGGLARWPLKLFLPLGFALLFLQGVAECIRRVAQLRGDLPFAPPPPEGGRAGEVV